MPLSARIGVEAVFDNKQFVHGLQEYSRGIADAEKRTEQASQNMTKSSKEVGTAWQATGALVVASATFLADKLIQVADRAVKGAYDLAEMGATVIRQRAAFEELATQAGGSADAILTALKRATDGTVADADIILAANKGIMLGLGAQADQWEKLAEVARFRARAMGLSVTQALSDITTGIGRQSKLILDNLGIILDTEQVYADYASSIGKAADALSDAEKKQAFLTSVITDGQAQIAAAGGIARDSADDFEEFAAALENAKAAIATWVAPEIAPAIGALADAIPGAVLRIQLLIGVTQGAITMEEMWAAAIESQRIQMELGDEAAASYVQEVLRVGKLVEVATGLHGEWTGAVQESTEAAISYAAALAGVNVVIGSMEQKTDAQIEGMKKAAKQYQQGLQEQAKAAEKAENERVKAQEKALQEMQRNEEQYASALSSLYDQIVSANKQAQEARLQEDRDYAAAALQLEQDLAREREKILQDLDRDINDNRRKERQKEVDAARDLARDLEDLNTKLSERNKATWAEYYAAIEQLTIEHGAAMKALTEKHAQERAAVEKKYAGEAEAPSLDAQREALQEELRLMKEQQEKTGILDKQREYEALQALEALKAEELALLEEAQAAEVAAEEAAYQEQQAKAQERRDAELAASQADYDAQAAQRQLAYDRQIEDLRIALQREQDERRLAAKRDLDDLRVKGEQERAELSAQHQARQAEIERGLQAETEGFRGAYATQLADLQTYLNQRTQQWRDHQTAIESILGISSPSKWMQDIGKQLRAGLDVGFQGPSIATDLQSAVASFGKSMNNLSLPMSAGGGGSSTSNTTHNHNLSVTANYTKPQSERSLRDDLRLSQSMMRMRGGW